MGCAEIKILTPGQWQDYELLDSGDGCKLERFGQYRLLRPEAEAIWSPALPRREWDAAAATFSVSAEENGGHWARRSELPAEWLVGYKQMRFWARLSSSRHVGIFPEQAMQWDWIMAQVAAARRPLRVLNLFGYTGLASLAAASAGASVTHLDASRKVIAWARQNQEASGLADSPIRWIVDDALKFVQRESRRSSLYDGLILDPPKFGRGPKGEVWEFYKLIPALLSACRQALSSQPRFVVVTAYAVKASALTLFNALQEMMQPWQGEITAGEAALQETSAGRLLSTAVFGRWSAQS